LGEWRAWGQRLGVGKNDVDMFSFRPDQQIVANGFYHFLDDEQIDIVSKGIKGDVNRSLERILHRDNPFIRFAFGYGADHDIDTCVGGKSALHSAV